MLVELRKILLCLLIALPLLKAQNPRQPGQLVGAYVPLTAEEKWKFHFSKMVQPGALTGSALIATAELIDHSPREWGQGFSGYSKRYFSALGAIEATEGLRFGLEAALREDPRYYPSDGAPKRNRIWNALKQTFITRTDSGNDSFAYGRVAGAFGAGQLTRLWLPSSENSLSDGFRTAGITLGIDAAVNLMYEFVPRTRPK